MARDFGTVVEDSTLNVFFTTAIASGARTDFANVLEDADIVFVKDGTVATITSALAHTLSFNSDAGIYKLAIDLSADADFTAGSDWTVYGHPDTEQLDSVDVAFIICTFTIQTANQAKLDSFASVVITGAAVTGTLSTTQATSDLTGYVDDELIGRTVVFTGGTADGQAARITDYASASGLITFTTLATAPANADTFVIL